MKKNGLISILLFSLFQEVGGQDFQLVATSKRKDKYLLGHYTLSNDNYAGSELFLYKNGRFVYHSYTDLAKKISTGQWLSKGNVLELKSEFGQGRLPVAVSYLQRTVSDSATRKFAIVKDLEGREYSHAAILVNDDSVSCFWGDMECFGSYKSIDSVKIVVDDEIYSQWVRVDSTRGIIQLTLQTDVDLHLYLPLDIRLKKENGKLKIINN